MPTPHTDLEQKRVRIVMGAWVADTRQVPRPLSREDLVMQVRVPCESPVEGDQLVRRGASERGQIGIVPDLAKTSACACSLATAIQARPVPRRSELADRRGTHRTIAKLFAA